MRLRKSNNCLYNCINNQTSRNSQKYFKIFSNTIAKRAKIGIFGINFFK